MQPWNSRSGQTVQQKTGYLAFVPAALPPTPPLVFDAEMIRLMSDADLAIGRLGGVAALLPNPDLFVAMYVRKEALMSSEIEGIHCTLDQVLEVEGEGAKEEGVRSKDVAEVVNYVRALNFGIERLKTLPLSLRLIRELHAELMSGTRGQYKDPGEFRRTQNWIGPVGCKLTTAAFVPPPVEEMNQALHDLERFMHDSHSMPLMVQCALVHAQFETIHPFLDGNGRLGRLLVPLILQDRGVLPHPLLYISLFLKTNRQEYYDRLTDIRQRGNWEGWCKFFLVGMAQVAKEAGDLAQEVVLFREKLLNEALGLGTYHYELAKLLFMDPLLDTNAAAKLMKCSYVSAQTALHSLEKLGYLTETSGKKRGKIYRFSGYLDLFSERPAQQEAQAEDAVDTEADRPRERQAAG